METLLRYRSTLPDEVVAEALARLGAEKVRSGHLDLAAPLLRESMDLFGRIGDRLRAAWATQRYAETLVGRREYGDALALFEQTLSVFRELDNQAMVADTLHAIGETLRERGELERAREVLREAIAIADSTGQNSLVMRAGLADLAFDQRKLNDAETLYERARRAAASLKDMFVVSYCHAGLACIAALRGDAELAGERWARAERILEDIGERFHEWDRERYERILGPLTNDRSFRRGYEARRAASTEPTPVVPLDRAVSKRPGVRSPQ